MFGALTSYAPSFIKKRIWDQKYSAGKWKNFSERMAGDFLYPYLERHAKGGSILDLGCGTGTTANEIALSAYNSYVGLDISVTALDKARERSEITDRARKHTFLEGDFLKYSPQQQFDVILFRESLYHVPLGRIKTILDRYAKHLKGGGVFIVRIMTKQNENGREKFRPIAMIRAIESGFEVIEKVQYGELGDTLVVFRPMALD